MLISKAIFIKLKRHCGNPANPYNTGNSIVVTILPNIGIVSLFLL